MAIDLGQLKQYQAEKGVKFEWHKPFHVQVTVEQGLAFKVAQYEQEKKLDAARDTMRNGDPKAAAEAAKEHRMIRDFGAFEIMAPIFGSEFHYPTKAKPPRFDGGVLAELLDNDMDWGTLERLVTTLYLTLVNTEDVAEEYMKSGKFEKALAIVAAREKAEADALATPQEPGETNGTD